MNASDPKTRLRPANGKPRRGRPRDAGIDDAALRAAHEEFVRHGYHALSMERIAARAGVSKVSLYRRWKNKADVIGEVFRRMGSQQAVQSSGDLASFLRELFSLSMSSADARRQGRVVMRTMGEIADNPELLALYRKHLLEPRMDQLRQVIDGARERGEVTSRAPTDVICALVAGPLFLFYLTLLVRLDIRFEEDPADQLVSLILRSLQ